MTAMHNSQEGRAEANGLRADSTFRERHGFHCLRAYCLVFLLSASRLAAAQSVELTPSKTNTLIQVTSSAGSAQLSNGQGDIYVGRTNQDGQGPATISIRRGLIAFDIADNVPAGATITGVTLTVEEIRGLNGNQFTSLNRMYRDWGQGTSYFNGGQGVPASNGDATWYYTFYNAADPATSPTWTVPGGEPGIDYSATASALVLDYTGDAFETLSWSSTANPLMVADVQAWLDSPATNFGWIILGSESIGQTAKRYGGQNAAAYGETPPQLTVQYAPRGPGAAAPATLPGPRRAIGPPDRALPAPVPLSCWAVRTQPVARWTCSPRPRA